MDSNRFARPAFVRHNEVVEVSFTRASRKHRVSYADMLHAMTHARTELDISRHHPDQDDRIMFLGPATLASGEQPLEVVAAVSRDGRLVVLHAMPMRAKYAPLYEPKERS